MKKISLTLYGILFTMAALSPVQSHAFGGRPLPVPETSKYFSIDKINLSTPIPLKDKKGVIWKLQAGGALLSNGAKANLAYGAIQSLGDSSGLLLVADNHAEFILGLNKKTSGEVKAGGNDLEKIDSPASAASQNLAVKTQMVSPFWFNDRGQQIGSQSCWVQTGWTEVCDGTVNRDGQPNCRSVPQQGFGSEPVINDTTEWGEKFKLTLTPGDTQQESATMELIYEDSSISTLVTGSCQ